MDSVFKERILEWHLKAKEQTDEWIIFILYYLIYDAYLTQGSSKNEWRAKLNWFIDSNDSLASTAQLSLVNLESTLIALKEDSPIKDQRPTPNGESYLSDIKNIKQIFEFIYQIRCNLFHGSKDVSNEKDNRLVLHGGRFLKTIIDKWLVNQ